MKTVIAALLSLITTTAIAAEPVLKDKYIKCNCHVTPGVTSATPAVYHHAHHAHKAAPAAPVEIPPPSEAKKEEPKYDTWVSHMTYENGYLGRTHVVSSNKPVLPAGKSVYAAGQRLYLSGRVLDSHCVPVSDAIVDIWQADASGRNVSASLADRLSPYPTFAGSGRAVTDNLGRFSFVTVFPGSQDDHAPFIHVHVAQHYFRSLDTNLFFGDDRRNEEDPRYTHLSPEQRPLVTAKIWPRDANDPGGSLVGEWDITLTGTNPYRRF